ncbi:hypothetical protein [Actinomyces respiraculi]|uniref:hypothetical protein n=1 Tax=Actinomyces respiraculi TaxID=2744574 RepID=UPI00142274C9|nr:hypothetical protein [Actinomyces respiraculi]
MSGLHPRGLLDQAYREIPTGRPPEAALRRATSTAYYAVFHLLSRHAAQYLIREPTGEWTTRHAAVARWVTHKDLAELATAVRSVGDPSRTHAIHIAFDHVDPRVTDLVEAFVVLQDARHRADYDPSYLPTKYLTLVHVEQAADALSKGEQLWHEQELSYQRFLALALGGLKVARRRH